MATYTTQMDAARQGLITPQMKMVAEKEEMFRLSMDSEKARRYRAEAKPEKEDTCSMCGNFCAVKNTNRILEGEIVSIFDG